jgi:SM-20-related protein
MAANKSPAGAIAVAPACGASAAAKLPAASRLLRDRASIDEMPLGALAVRDSLVSPRDQAKIHRLLSQPIWQYGWQSDPRRDRYAFWHVHFAGGHAGSRVNCERELARFSALAPINRLWMRLRQTVLRGHEPVRVYANAHTYGVEGYVHIDNPDTKNYFSTLYYAHPRWHKNWSGETVFYTRRANDITASVYPKPGRVVSFHGAVPHCARAPSRECPELRLTVVFKTQLRRS